MTTKLILHPENLIAQQEASQRRAALVLEMLHSQDSGNLGQQQAVEHLREMMELPPGPICPSCFVCGENARRLK